MTIGLGALARVTFERVCWNTLPKLLLFMCLEAFSVPHLHPTMLMEKVGACVIIGHLESFSSHESIPEALAW